MKVIVKKPGMNATVENIDNTLEALQELVGGYIETITIASDLVMIVNEEGLLLNLPYNINFCGVDIVGTAVFAGVDGDEFCDVPIGIDQMFKTEA